MRILMIEDDRQLCDAVCIQLQADGYETDACYNGIDYSYYLENGNYDVILIDRMLPGKDGIQILEEIRARRMTVPVILVTALGELADKVEGLDAGADDYLSKPYSVEELKARIRALMRRPHQIEDLRTLKVADTSLEPGQMLLICKEKRCSLTKKESSLLEYFFTNPRQILTREQILSKVWGADHFVENGNVDTYVHFVRRRLKTVESSLMIKSVHGVGYMLTGEKL